MPAAFSLFRGIELRTLILVCALTAPLVGCSSQQPTQPSCIGLNGLACLVGMPVAVEPASNTRNSAAGRPVSLADWHVDRSPRPPVRHAVHRAPQPIKVAAIIAPPISTSLPSPPNQPKAINVAASQTARAGAADQPTTAESAAPRTTQQQVASATAVAERMSAPTVEGSLDTLVAVVVAGPDVRSIADLAGKTIAIDDRYPESSVSRVRIAIVAAGALEVQVSKGQATAINRLVDKEVPAAVIGLVSASAASSFPEIARFRTFQIPLSPQSDPAKP
jgi:hypothetical protein